ncbi:SdrD B-like domain-containing protein [Streptomyces sulphureus]|uniref:SdrD B-like domain-containing protein n=1 Tax=Streptomyces sulphureus TaxID=47758 RepID=UPI00037D853A|nr:SdrD B-like domain-containing protein [Streptomyces sulphureus]
MPTPPDRTRPLRGALAVLPLAAALLAAAPTPDADGAGADRATTHAPAVTASVSAVEPRSRPGGRIAYRIRYACSATAAPCKGVRLTAAPPEGGSPDGGVVPGSGRGTENPDTRSVTGGGPVVFDLRDLRGGTTGELEVDWRLPDRAQRTAYRQTVLLTADGRPDARLTSGAATTGAPRLAAALRLVGPPARADGPTTYELHDCAPALGYRDLRLRVALPRGTVFKSATGGGTWDPASSTITWQVRHPSPNDCDRPRRTYSFQVVPPPSDRPGPSDVRLDATATATAPEGPATARRTLVHPLDDRRASEQPRPRTGDGSSAVADLFVRTRQTPEWSRHARLPAAPDAGPIDHRLRVTDRGGGRLGDLVLYDVLARKGDTASGARPRGSTRSPRFARTTDVPAGVQVAYSASENPCRPELFPDGQGPCEDDWTTAPPPDPSRVRALRFKAPALPDGGRRPLRIDYRMTAPDEPTGADPGATRADVAWHATRRDASGETHPLLPATSRAAVLDRYGGRVTGRAWSDADRDGRRQPDERPLRGVEVTLLDAEGTKTATTRTAADGSYALAAPFGRCTLAFAHPEGRAFTRRAASGDPAADSAVHPRTGRTTAVTTPDRPEALVNAGLLEPRSTGSPALGGPRQQEAAPERTGFPVLEPAVAAVAAALLGLATLARRRRRSEPHGGD